jgi:hypothetical protein
MTTLDLDNLISTVQAHSPGDVICKKAALLELAERLRAAEKDAGRLDFLIAEGCEVTFSHLNEKYYLSWHDDNVVEMQTGNYDTAREAIDAAIDQQRKIATGEDLGL